MVNKKVIAVALAGALALGAAGCMDTKVNRVRYNLSNEAELKRDFFKLQTYEERKKKKKYVRWLLNHKGENNDH